jgi:hypothetical protein
MTACPGVILSCCVREQRRSISSVDRVPEIETRWSSERQLCRVV